MAPSRPARGRARLAALALAAFGPPLAARAALQLRPEAGLAGAVPAGLASDLLVGAAVLGILVCLAGRARALAALGAAGHALVQAIQVEHVAALGASASWRYASQLLDPTFVAGSMSHPPPAAIAGVALAGLAAWVGAGRRLVRHAPAALLGAGAAIALATALPVDGAAERWRQSNVVAENLRSLLLAGGAAGVSEAPLGPAEAATVERVMALDLAGEPRVAPPAGAPNVLLLMLEGGSDAYLEAAADPGAGPDRVQMPRLAAIAGSGLHFRRFLANQRQTTRGQYAALCGDLPHLLSREPKATTAAARGEPLACLPRRLAAAGYRTEYLQGAPLAYMAKERFMPLAGFEGARGAHWFAGRARIDFWGVGDAALLDEAFATVERLRAGGRPWLLAVLNVGTHHPYTVPGPDGAPRPSTLAESMAHLDRQVERLVDRLRGAGALADTLVLITSDESAGDAAIPASFARRLATNRGLLVALTPTGERAVVDEPFSQVDLAASVLDYVGAGERARGLHGRSVFRRHADPAPVPFGNTYEQRVGLLAPTRLTWCDEAFASCETRALPPSGPLPATAPRVATDAAAVHVLAALARRASGEGEAGPRALDLLPPDPLPVVAGGAGQYLAGGQNLWVAAGTRLRLGLDVAVLGREAGVDLALSVGHDADDTVFARTVRGLRPGDRLEIALEVDTPRALERAFVRLGATRRGPGEAALRFDRARLELRPDEGSGGVWPPRARLTRARLHRDGRSADLAPRLR